MLGFKKDKSIGLIFLIYIACYYNENNNKKLLLKFEINIVLFHNVPDLKGICPGRTAKKLYVILKLSRTDKPLQRL